MKKNIIRSYNIIQKSKKNKELLKTISMYDNTLEYKTLRERVAICFYIIQESWMKNEISRAKNYMSEKLYSMYSKKINELRTRNRINIAEDIILVNVKPIEVIIGETDNNDYIWMYVKGTRKSYQLDAESKSAIKETLDKGVFKEYWKFIRGSEGWILDETLKLDDVSEKVYFEERLCS
ncbi:TIM44-like domain-containing protein [Clostridium bornimense]|nr:TIM44-like domain-containing protein [Clostridium bornimense]